MADDFKVGVVITSGAGRKQNVEDCLAALLVGSAMTPEAVVLVLDGHDEIPSTGFETDVPIHLVHAPKHQPGMEQPRNIGARELTNVAECTHVWFVDSDILMDPHALASYFTWWRTARDVTYFNPILIGPYEWLPGGAREVHPEIRNDFRWEMFDERGHRITVAELGVALGCFGGNLVWPIEEFVRVGGFHPQLYHGRCEDGELGLRAAAHEIPMMLVAEARGYHMAHEVDVAAAEERNRRDVPLLNSWHPWVEHAGLIVTARDGARFEFLCDCGQQVNTLGMWAHMATHREHAEVHNGVELVLPDGMA